jgi:hypothetical protein
MREHYIMMSQFIAIVSSETTTKKKPSTLWRKCSLYKYKDTINLILVRSLKQKKTF